MRCATRIPATSWMRSPGSRRPSPTSPTNCSTRLAPFNALQWGGALGTPTMHIDHFVRGKGQFLLTEIYSDRREDRATLPADADDGPHSVAIQCRARRPGVRPIRPGIRRDVLEIHPHDAEDRGIRDGDWVKIKSRAGETALRAKITERNVARGCVHNLPPSAEPGECRHDRLFGLGDQLS